jgi:AraC-like DNA-binding protein
MHQAIPHIHELARRVGMSESKLKRAFKEHFGTIALKPYTVRRSPTP